MANLISSIIISQQEGNNKTISKPSFTIDTTGKVTPLEYKGKLLPSRIIGSPVTYAKDLKDDFVNIKDAANGKSNDYKLGRINDVAMKLGSLALASYLFVKNPLKLNKVKEYIGFGTFFASMAVWPKLAIQLPIKARTGVDIHQKYIDSQGRKKMLYLDPQYVLTDLYSREDLDRIGKGLKVSENLPDRDNFIKQRAQKTALQGNTLWMMTAGAATPVMSALACNALEKPVSKLIEHSNLVSTNRAINTPEVFDNVSIMKSDIKELQFSKFLKKNKNKSLSNPEFMSQLFEKLSAGTNSATINDGLKQELNALLEKPTLSAEAIQKILKDKVDISSLSDNVKEELNKAISEQNFNKIAELAADTSNLTGAKNKKARNQFINSLVKTLKAEKSELKSNTTVQEASERLMSLYKNLSQFGRERKILDDYINVRAVGAGSYVANHWERVSNKFLNGLTGKTKSFLSPKELKAIADGDIETLSKCLDKLAGSKNYNKVVMDLINMVNGYEEEVGESFLENVEQKGKEIFKKTSNNLKKENFIHTANKISSNGEIKDTAQNALINSVKENVSGARSSFYRLLQTIDLFKQVQDGSFESVLRNAIEAQGQTADKATIDRLISLCKKYLLTATTTDNVEKLKSAGFNVSEDEFKIMMNVLYNSNAENSITRSLSEKIKPEEANKLLEGFNSYKEEYKEKVVNWVNGITPELSRRTQGEAAQSADAVARNSLVGKSVLDFAKDAAAKRLRSDKWLKIFGGGMIVLTAATIAATFAIGRKSKAEKELEAENKVNG